MGVKLSYEEFNGEIKADTYLNAANKLGEAPVNIGFHVHHGLCEGWGRHISDLHYITVYMGPEESAHKGDD